MWNQNSLAPRLGPRVTTVRVRDGVHDLVLSTAEARELIFTELDLWLSAYLPDRAEPRSRQRNG
ncbi:hypothetical protein HUT19_02045 [Streptomyces sp. NA02950]|uniref:hypothetical protein n=1 Tax=Streptomyces sp. NA02950 TaxID=2742137 RepID=UPI001591B67F|nr:hypothetical protein [Streptomyces sp. NA02950]QKV90683.1 hypothetical protein HUT19_02045 [Streptomyces sp. NA02950]